MDKQTQINELVKQLNAASEAYYSGKDEIMSDYEWDKKFNELEKLEQETGIILLDSPTHNVSHEEVTGQKEKHEFPALSLPKSKNIEDVVRWTNGKVVDLSWKLDGLTLVVTYDNGELSRVVTRGDGEVGSNITHLAKAIRNIPDTISYTGHLVIRGEAVISYDDFERVNLQCNHKYENPRNLAAGSCNPAIKTEAIVDRGLVWLPFTLVHVDDDISRWSDRMLFLKSLGFDVVDFTTITHPGEISETIKRWSNSVDKIIYPVDGLVVVYEDTEYASQGNLTGHHDTRGGYAFKWADESAETELDHIEWSVSITSINPVAVFDTVRLEGTNVCRASLCNISECKRLGIGDRGTKLTVIKANKIIPKVVSAITKGELFIPDKCPVCGGDTEVVVSDTGVETLICSNDNCAAKHVSRLARFASLKGFDIMGLSEKRLAFLVDKGLISNVCDIFELANKPEVYTILSDAEGWGKRSVDKLFRSINAAKTVKAEKFLYALCIPSIGTDAAKKIAKMGPISKIINEIESGNIDYFKDSLSDIKTDELFKWFGQTENKETVKKLMSLCDIEDTSSDKGVKFAGLTFVVTGKLRHYASRDALKVSIEREGGKVSESISSNTSYLINNDLESTSGKNKKAKMLGIPIISEEDFINMIDSN